MTCSEVYPYVKLKIYSSLEIPFRFRVSPILFLLVLILSVVPSGLRAFEEGLPDAVAPVITTSCEGEDVIFADVQNVIIDGTLIEKDGPAQSWFSSANVLPASQDGYLCFELQFPTSNSKALGLRVSGQGNSFQSINYGFLINPDGVEQAVIHNGELGYRFFAAEGDRLKVERLGNQVSYYKNDVVLQVLEVENNFALRVFGWFQHWENISESNNVILKTVDGLFFQDLKVNFTVPQLTVCEGYDVFYTDFVHTTAFGTTIRYENYEYVGIHGGFASINEIPVDEDGYICFPLYEKDSLKVIGLSYDNQNEFSESINYSFFFKGLGRIIENGEVKYLFNPEEGDVFKIERTDGLIKYFQNDILLMTSEVDQDKKMIADGYFIGIGERSFVDVKMSHGISDTCDLVLYPNLAQVSYCEGDAVQLYGSGAAYYRWHPSTGLSCHDCPSPILSTEYGTVSSSYTLLGFTSLQSYLDWKDGTFCSTKRFEVNFLDDCQEEEEIIGCCFSNYGASVMVTPSTNLNIHCNLLNEVQLVGGELHKGLFENTGNIRVEKEWINNGYNNLYATREGFSELFGGYQRMRGNSSTHFQQLHLFGNGRKEIRIDEYAFGVLDLSSNELYIGDFTFFVENSAVDAIQYMSGFASTDGVGYLARQTTGDNYYSFPLGSTEDIFRVRPIGVYDVSQTGRYLAGFINHGPGVDGFSALAPNVVSINDLYYHRIQAPVASTNIGIRAYFNQGIDGDFQSLAHLETLSANDLIAPFWESTPAATIPVTPPPGLLYLESSGEHDFDGEPFVLAQAGFYINTDDFGNENGDSGTTITIVPSGGNEAAGGGLGAPNETGENTTVTPFPLPGDYEIEITTEGESEEGDITFTVDEDGTIDEESLVFTDEGTGESGSLSPDLYDIDTISNGIILHDTPPDLNFDCTSSISIAFGSMHPLVLDIDLSESILIEGISTTNIAALNFEIWDRNEVIVYNQTPEVSSNITLGDLSLSPGAYHFRLGIEVTVGREQFIHGQFIAK